MDIPYDNKNVIVTGGAGYIGSRACKVLYEKGYNPITIDNISTGWREAVKFEAFEEVDLLDEQKVFSVFSKYRPSAARAFCAFSQVAERVSPI